MSKADLMKVVTLPVVRIERLQERPSEPWDRELVKAIAMDIGKAAVHHLETMCPAAIAACPPNMKLSLRNSIHNEIMAALETSDAEKIKERLRVRKEHRRRIKAAYTKAREPDKARKAAP
jgi:hypothetical protein